MSIAGRSSDPKNTLITDPKIGMSVADRIREKGGKSPVYQGEPVWEGPESNGNNGGISYSLLTRYLTCKERFRLQVVEGLRPAPSFVPVLDFGSMWHLCEEAYLGSPNGWNKSLTLFCQGLCRSFPTQQQQINHWYEICKALFPLYIQHYRSWPKRENYLREQTFKIAYKLPSGRQVWLRGKWDSVDKTSEKTKDRFWVWENKTKSSIDIVRLTTQLTYDLQTLFYVVALGSFLHNPKKIAGIVYNVIRRSAHRSVDSMLKKIQEDSDDGRIEEWFWRKEIPISPEKVERFQNECLDPILENLCQWWDTIKANDGKAVWGAKHCRHPYGCRNIIDEGGSTDLDHYMNSGGDPIGLVKSEELFPELK